jgi:hypothetical protein
MTRFHKLFAAIIAPISAITLFVLLFVPPAPPARAQLASSQTWAGTAGGTSSALTLTVHNVVSLNDLLGVPIRFIANGTVPNGTPGTLVINIDTGGSLPSTAIVRPTQNIGIQPLAGGELHSGQMGEVTYDGVNGFVITSAIDMTPVGDSVEIRGGSAPPGVLIEDGSCISPTAFPSLSSVIGTTYNSGAPVACTGSNFAVPFSNGTVFAALDNQGANTANRITSAATGCAATAPGVECGNQVVTIGQSNLPNVTLSVSVTSNTGNILVGNLVGGVTAGGGGGAEGITSGSQNTPSSTGATSSINGGVTQTNVNKLPPLLTGRRGIKA